MKLHILSDLHIDFKPFDLPDTDADVIVLAGDTAEGLVGIEWANTLNKPVLFIPGNHEYYGTEYFSHLMAMRETAASHVTVMDNDAIEIQGITFLGATLWTDFNLWGNVPLAEVSATRFMPDYKDIRLGSDMLTPSDTQAMNANTVQWLANQLTGRQSTEKVVVITHHAPTLKMQNPKYAARGQDPYAPAFLSNLDWLIVHPVKLWISGHVHYSTTQIVNDIPVVSNARGYPHESDSGFNPALVIEI